MQQEEHWRTLEILWWVAQVLIWWVAQVLILAAPIVLAFWAWFYVSSQDPNCSYLLHDALSLLGAIGVVWMIRRWWGKNRSKPLNFCLSCYLTVVTFWLLMPLSGAFRVGEIPVSEARWTSGWRHPEAVSHGVEWREAPVGLALSGGGYRAAVFHAGVLEMMDRLALRPTHLSTVSGGSIIGAFYWRGGAPEDFRDAVATSRFYLIRRLVTLPEAFLVTLTWSDRLDSQVRLLDERLLAGEAHVRRSEAQRPRLVINATDLAYGLQVGFTEQKTVVTGETEALVEAQEERLSLSQRVAISGSFPYAFPVTPHSVSVFDPMPLHDREQPAMRRLLLVDGGIGDNTGLGLLSRLDQRGCAEITPVPGWCITSRDGILVSSDAGAVFAVKSKVGPIGMSVRMFDVSWRLADFWRKPKPDSEVVVAPHRSFFSVQETFSFPDAAVDLGPGGFGVRNAPFDPLRFPVVILRALGELLSNEEERRRYAHHLQHFVDVSEFHRSDPTATPTHRLFSYAQFGGPHQFTTYENCTALEDKRSQRPELCEAVALRLLVLRQLERDLLVFAKAGTLADSFTPDQANAIFRAGQTIVLLRWHAFLRGLGPPEWAAAVAATHPKTPEVSETIRD